MRERRPVSCSAGVAPVELQSALYVAEIRKAVPADLLSRQIAPRGVLDLEIAGHVLSLACNKDKHFRQVTAARSSVAMPSISAQ